MSDQDQNIFDLILLTIGVLVGVAVGLFIIARDVNNATLTRMRLDDPAYQMAVTERIEPFGRLALNGEVIADDSGLSADVVPVEAAPTVMTGPQVYNAACLACHGAGIAGAPKTGDKALWGPRIAQGRETLNQHALNGFQGNAGAMPAKGGRTDLSDAEIIDAVTYMVQQAQ